MRLYALLHYRTLTFTRFASTSASLAPAIESAGTGGIRIRVRVQPGAHKSAVAQLTPAAVHIRVHAPAHDNAANTELIRFVASRDVLDVPKSNVTLVRGMTSRDKLLSVCGITAAAATERFERAVAASFE